MDGAMGKEEEVVEAVLTCEGDFHDPELLNHLEKFRLKLRDLLLADEAKLNLKKVEPWNSVKVTFTIPKEAALRLRQLAQTGNEALRQMGVLSVQLQGDSSISLKIAGRNNETTELMLQTSKGAPSVGPLPVEHGVNTTNEVASSPGPSNEEVTRKNIVDYLIQGPPHLRPNAIFNSILGVNASATTPILGSNRGAPPPDSFPGPGTRPLLRPNSIANMAPLSSPALRGSHPNSFPFVKTSGAFHIPIPHQSSAGQSVSGIPNQQMNSFPVTKNIPGHMNSSGLQHCGSQQKNMPLTMNTFGPIGSKMPSSSNISSSLPPSSSPGFMIDLPPPPPYPHSSCNNSNKSGKQVSASSPLLVNLLQTDPIAVAASNTSKTVTTGNTSPAPPVKKKKRPKKPKESVSNSYSNSDDIILKRDVLGINPNMFNPPYSAELSRIPTSSTTFSTKLQEYIPGSAETAHGFSHVQKSDSKTVADKAFKPLISTDRPFSENSINSSAFSFTKLNTSVDSAIASDHVRSKETNGQGEEVIDSFSREIAAGKIINPYTGQLEPRDSILDSNSGRVKDHSNLPEEITSHVSSSKTKEIGTSNSSNVPASVSQVMDINVLRNLSTVSSSTAAFFRSGSSPHLSGDKHSSQIPPHRRNLSDSSVSTSKNIYAAKLNSKPEIEHSLTSISSTLSQSTFNPHQVSVSSIQHQMKSSNILPSAASSTSIGKPQIGRPVFQSGLPSHTVPSSSLSSGVSESVINSNLGSSCSSTALSVTNQDTFVKHLEHNPTIFQLTSCANSNTQTSFPHHSLSSKMFSSSSSSVVQTRPVSSQAQSSFQVSERLKSTNVSKSFSSQHVEAASSDSISSTTTKTNFTHLLNSLPEKSLDQQSMIRSPSEKVSPEGDDNSNHSGLVSENIPESSGTSVLLEHANVKAENHDSGVGSSSERSDDTPSEPGDGEFRANTNCSEAEETNKTAKRLANCKTDVDSSSANTITVGYMMSSVEAVSQPKSSQPRQGHDVIKTTSISLAKGSSNSKIDPFFDTHANSLNKNVELPTSHSFSSPDWMGKESQLQSSTYSGKVRLNGPIQAEKEDRLKLFKKEFKHDTKLNGPSSKDMEEMLLTMADLQGKNEQLPSKNNAVFKRHGLHLQHEVLEEMAKLQQLAASKDLVSVQGKLEKEDSSESIPRGLGSNEERQDQLPFFDMDDLVNGKLFGNGPSNIDSKTGSNITSIYSKRSSPVNVNMLNHIYAPGLPLPRRLTESVQRLVKPLPASESSMPQMRLCKSPGAGSPRAGSGINGPSPSRMALHSGTRSPGASIPKLLSNDKHSLLSGGLDLAGLSKFPPNSIPHSDFASESVSESSSRMLGLTTDFLSREGHSRGFLSSCHVSPPLLTDSLAHSHKMLSQSYPPHKSRDLANKIALYDLFSHMQPHQSSSAESVSSSLQDSSPHLSKTSCEPAISSHHSQVLALGNLPKPPKTGAQTDSLPVSTFNHSVLSSTHLLTSETFPKNQETVSLSKSSNTHEVFSISSPNHSSSVSPTFLANSDKIESSNLSNANKSFQTASGTNVSAPRVKISLSNGSSSSLINQKVAISTQNNVPYLSSSSSTVSSSTTLLAKSVASRMTPAVSSAFLSGSAVRDTADPLMDNLGLLKSTKSDTNISPRAPVKSDFSLSRPNTVAPSLSRNLFESVSCDLTSLPHSVVQTSRSKAIDTLVSHSSSKSVLDLNHAQDFDFEVSKTPQRKNSESALGPISPQLNYNSDIVLNSSQSIRTNETPSTSLPAKVVHLDFPHFRPTVSETPIGNSVSVSQKLVKSPIQSSKVINHNWNPTPSPESVTTFPARSRSKIDPVAHTSTSVASEKNDSQSKDFQRTSIQRTPSPSLVKEPILETLASAFGSSLIEMPNDQTGKLIDCSSSSVSNSNSKIKEDSNFEFTDKIVPDISDRYTSDKLDFEKSASSSDLEVSSKISRKRSFSVMEGDQNEDCVNPSTDHSTAKHFVIDSVVNEVECESHSNVTNNASSTAEVIDKNSQRNNPSSDVDPMQRQETKIDQPSSLIGLSSKCSSNEPEGKVLISPQNSMLETKMSSEASQNMSNISEIDQVKDTRNSSSTSVLPTEISLEVNTQIQENDTDQNAPPTDDKPFEVEHRNESEEKESEPLEVPTVPEQQNQCSQASVQGNTNKEIEIVHREKDQREKDIVILGNKNVIENMGSNIIEDSHSESKIMKDTLENITDQESLVMTGNAESKMEEGAKKGHRTKRQFYAYVPEKSIDQTYFDTPILSGRTRSRNKPTEPVNPDQAANQEGSNVTTGLSDSQGSTIVAGAKTDSNEAVGSKRSTRSLRTKDNAQDFSASKRRRLQPRDHR